MQHYIQLNNFLHVMSFLSLCLLCSFSAFHLVHLNKQEMPFKKSPKAVFTQPIWDLQGTVGWRYCIQWNSKKGRRLTFLISSCAALWGNMWLTRFQNTPPYHLGFLCFANVLTVKLGTLNPWLMVYYVCGNLWFNRKSTTNMGINLRFYIRWRPHGFYHETHKIVSK